jgi:hypothetical protein
VAVASGCGGADRRNAVQVKALWYGTAQDGGLVGGVTPVDIAAVEDDPQTPLRVDVRGLKSSGAGPMWTAATSVAGVQAVLISGVDPRVHQLRYGLREAIDGPSAGALLSVGSLAALRGSKVSSSTTMTGTVLPDGSVGLVSGVAEKLRAAAAAGFTRILVPTGMPRVFDDKTGRETDLAQLGRSLGVQVTPVKSVPDAYAMITGQTVRSGRRPPPFEPRILRMLTRRSRALIVAADGYLNELSGRADRAASSAAAHVSVLVRAAERALTRQDPVLAFAAAAEAAQAGRLAVASERLHAAARHATLRELAAQISRRAERSMAAIRAQVHRTAEIPVTKVAQLTALADTLAWGAFAMTSMTVARERLEKVRSKADLDEIVQFLEVGRFEAATYMTACAESLRYIGIRPITDHTVGLLNAYGDLIAYAADTNRTYADSLGLGTTNASYLGDLIEQSDAFTRTVSPAFRDLSGKARAAWRMSVALLEYVETTQLVNDLTYRDSKGNESPPNLEPIKDPATVHTQALNADEIARRRIRDIAAARLDPAFVQWNSRWGADLAFGRLPNTTGEQRLHGLEFQWFAVLQGRLLTALNR